MCVCVCVCVCMESRRTALMNLFSEQQRRQRHGEETHGQCGGEEGEGEMDGESYGKVYTDICK